MAAETRGTLQECVSVVDFQRPLRVLDHFQLRMAGTTGHNLQEVQRNF